MQYRYSNWGRLALSLLLFGQLAVPFGTTAEARWATPPVEKNQKTLLTRFYYQMALQAASIGQPELSTDLLERISWINPGNLPFALKLGELFRAQGKQQKALDLYRDLLTRFDDPLVQSVIHYRMSLVYDALNQSDQVIAALNQAISLFPETKKPAFFYYDLGVAYAKRNEYDMTRHYSEKALALDPNFAQAWNNLGYSLAKLGRYEEGHVAVKQALKLAPDNVNALDSLGYIEYHLKRYDASIDAFKKALSQDPRLADSLLYLGKAYEATRSWKDAVDAYENYLIHANDEAEKAAVRKTLLMIKTNQLTQSAPVGEAPPGKDKPDSPVGTPGAKTDGMLNADFQTIRKVLK